MAKRRSETIHYDWLIKLNLQRFGRDLVAWLFQETPLEVRPIDTTVPALRIGQADKIFDVQFSTGRPVLLHVEWQLHGRATMPGRMADYLSLILGLLRSSAHAGKDLAAVVIYFDRSTYRKDPGILEVRGQLDLLVFFRYRVVKLWEVDPELVLSMESPGLCPFLPLMRGNPEELLVKSKEKILQTSGELASFAVKKELLAVLAGLATRVIVDRNVLMQVVSEIQGMGENYVFDLFFNRGRDAGLREGREEGREEGALIEAREAILRILRRRFGGIPEDVSRRLQSISSRPHLEALIEDAAVAVGIDEFLRRLDA